MKILCLFGTRPEAVKMCPLILELKKQKEIACTVCVTGQHLELLHQVLDIFGITPDYDLGLMKENQTLTQITAGILSGLEKLLPHIQPDLILVHGDTTTSAASALAAFYHKIPVGHVEAGLRTDNHYSPYPEEMNRRLISQISTLSFSPTHQNLLNLKRENYAGEVYVTGNTGLDALRYTIQENYQFKRDPLNRLCGEEGRLILLTAHRRENQGMPLENICRAVIRLVREYTDLQLVFPVHPNPTVSKAVYSLLGNQERIHLIAPLDVEDLHNFIAKCYLILTDSGGLQEEGAALGVPVVVLRRETERPEAVQAGAAILAGTDEDTIYTLVSHLLDHSNDYAMMAKAQNPFGDGYASKRITQLILQKWSNTLRKENLSG